jgi:hypothetical protein
VLASAKRIVSNASECFLDCSPEPQVSLVQVDLKFRFRIRIRLVDGISLPAPGRRNRTTSFGAGDRHFAPFF